MTGATRKKSYLDLNQPTHKKRGQGNPLLAAAQ